MATLEALTISDAAAAAGVTTHTLRYYERAGLMLERVGRTAATHRRYTDAEVNWVILLGRLRATGMPIRRMREYADLVREGEGNERERLELLETHRGEVLAQLAEVRRSLEAIDTKIALYREKLS
jgi:DNA-binding transcriptional MerR regulator